MARKPKDERPQSADLTPAQMRQGVERIKMRIADLEAFDPEKIDRRWAHETKSVETAIDETLSRVFGHGTVEYRRYSDATDLDRGPLIMDREDSPAEIHQYLRDGKARSLALLQQAVRGLEEELGMVAEIGSPAGPARRSAPRSIPAETPDKDDFVQKAPPYYELAVASYFDETSVDFFTVEALLGRFSTMYDILPIGVLLDHALAALREKNIVVEVPDDFGPTLYRKSPNFGAIWHGQKQPTPLFRKFYEMGNEQQRWLRGALSKINEQYAELGLTEQDFTQSTLDDKWEPIPLDRSDQRLQKATEALDEALEKIESSNGYAAEVPGERQYVLQSLKAGSRTLKESAQIYWVELKVFVLEPLGRVIKRFGTAVEGVAASAARDAFHDWLKIAFSKALEWWPF